MPTTYKTMTPPEETVTLIVPPAEERETLPPPELSVILPVYEEAFGLAESVDRLLCALNELGRSFELLVVEGGSDDSTPMLLMDLARADRRLRVVWLGENMGKGTALRVGMRAAHGEYVICLDADLPMDLSVFPTVLRRLEYGAEFVVGDRRHRRSEIGARAPRPRAAFERLFDLLARCTVDPGLRDFGCGLKAYVRGAARAIGARTWLDGRGCETEIVAVARSLGLERVSVPVIWNHVHERRPWGGRDALASVRDLALVVWGRIRGRYRA